MRFSARGRSDGVVHSNQLRLKPFLRAALLCALGWLAVGCGLSEWAKNGGKVGPNYKTPPALVAQNWIDYQNSGVAAREQDISRWWTVFRDPVLDSLIDEAYQQNLSL